MLGMNQPPATKVPYYRTTLSLPASLATDISRLAKRLGVSQSAMLSELLADPIAALCAIFDELPQAGATSADVRRAKGKGLAMIREAMAEAQAMVTQETEK